MGKSASRCARRGREVERASLYDQVTSRIIAELEEGRIPWVRPWDRSACTVGMPRNAVSGRAYSGINVLLLWSEVIERGWPGQGWLTFRQALALGGHVAKGEQGVTVVYADRFTPEAEKERASRDGDEARGIAFLKRFTVFNIAQCEGLPAGLGTDAPALPEREIIPVGEALIHASAADFRIGGDEAFYAPGPDFIRVPPQQAFRDHVNFYRTALHELGHWTGHVTRLARDQAHSFGSRGYAQEELIAELCSAYLCATLGIQPTVRHADYVGAWLDVLRNDNRAIFRAASAASKAADFLLTLGGPAIAQCLGERS